MAAEETGVVIESAKLLRFPRKLSEDRVKKLRALRFVTHIDSWAKPSGMVEETAIVVKLKQRRERTKLPTAFKVWFDEYTVDHRHNDIIRLQDLLSHKKAQGYEVTVKDAVLAYMLVFMWGRKSVITGFYQADHAFPDLRGKVSIETVGSALSRLAEDNVIERVNVRLIREQLAAIERRGEGLPPPIRRERPTVEEHGGIVTGEFPQELPFPSAAKQKFIRYTLSPHRIEELEKKYGLHRQTVTSPYQKRGLLSIDAPFIPRYGQPPLKETLYRIVRSDLIHKSRWWET